MTKCKLLMLTFPFFLSGCANSRSDAISNSEFYVVTTVTGDPANNKVTCSTYLTVGGAGGTTITLDSSDKMSCGVSDVYHDMSEASNGHYTYDEMSYGVGTSYSVKLTRSGSEECGRSGTFVGTVTLPEAVTITAPGASASASRGSPISVTWTAGTGDSIEISLSATEGSAYFTTTDTGSYSIPADKMTEMQNGAATLRVKRIKNGQHPSGLKGGSTTAEQLQTISLTLTN